MTTALAGTTFVLFRLAAIHASDSGVPNVSTVVPSALVSIPAAAVGLALVWRRKATLLGRSFTLGALLLAVGRFGDAAVAFASPAPLGAFAYEFPGIGFVAVLGEVAVVAACGAFVVSASGSLGANRWDRRTRLAAKAMGAGVGVFALGVATTPDAIIPGFTSEVVSPFALPNFDAAASTLRLVGVLVAVVASCIAIVAAYERMRGTAAAGARALLATIGGTCVVAAAGYPTDAGLIRAAALVLAAVVLPCVVGVAGERLAVLDLSPVVDTAPRSGAAANFEALAIRALAVARLAAALWAWALFASFGDSFSGPFPPLLLVAAVVLAGVAAINAWRPFVDWRWVSIVEIAIAAGLVYVDGAGSGPSHLFSGESGLGGPWPTVVIAAAGASGGPIVGIAAGIVVGFMRVVGVVVSGEPVFAAQGQALAGGVAGLVVVGLASGALMEALRDAERRIASARAREAVARRLHDGVLQALAIVRRRSADSDLVALVTDADRDLRAFLDRGDADGEADFEERMRRAVDESERRFGLSVAVVIDELPRRVSHAVADAVVGAMSEALANVAKHAGLLQATVFAGMNEGEGFYVSVTDRGVGFDPALVQAGRGLSASVDGRMRDVGGSASVRPLTGGGTQVMLCLP